MTSKQTSIKGTVSGAELKRIRAKALIDQEEEDKSFLREFTRKLQVYTEGAKELTYRVRKGELKNVIKWGQRKLVLETIQFITLYWDPVKHPKPIFLYIGAAPGCTINIMIVLFPGLEWHLFDSSPFNRKIPNEKKGVHTYNRYFDGEGSNDIEEWKKKKDVFLISDIRDINYDAVCYGASKSVRSNQPKINKYDCEKLVIRDMLRQEKWVYEINPVAASLKFRLPWYQGLYTELNSSFPYLQGHAYYQPWVGPTSTETRLVPIKNEEGRYYSVNWNSQSYESVLFYHNDTERNTYKYINPFTKDGSHIDDMELTNDWDSLCETQILRDYLNKTGQPDTQENVKKLSRFITNTLLDIGRGCGDRTLTELRTSIIKPSGVEEIDSGVFRVPTI